MTIPPCSDPLFDRFGRASLPLHTLFNVVFLVACLFHTFLMGWFFAFFVAFAIMNLIKNDLRDWRGLPTPRRGEATTSRLDAS